MGLKIHFRLFLFYSISRDIKILNLLNKCAVFPIDADNSSTDFTLSACISKDYSFNNCLQTQTNNYLRFCTQFHYKRPFH